MPPYWWLVDTPMPVVAVPPEFQTSGARYHCRAADLNGSGWIDSLDAALAQRAVGSSPGPAAHSL